METSIGIKPENLSSIAQSLTHVFAGEFVLYTKTRNAHWNVEGPNFHSIIGFLKRGGEYS